MFIGVPAKRGQTQNTTVGTAKKGGKLLPMVRRVQEKATDETNKEADSTGKLGGVIG